MCLYGAMNSDAGGKVPTSSKKWGDDFAKASMPLLRLKEGHMVQNLWMASTDAIPQLDE